MVSFRCETANPAVHRAGRVFDRCGWRSFRRTSQCSAVPSVRSSYVTRFFSKVSFRKFLFESFEWFPFSKEEKTNDPLSDDPDNWGWRSCFCSSSLPKFMASHKPAAIVWFKAFAPMFELSLCLSFSFTVSTIGSNFVPDSEVRLANRLRLEFPKLLHWDHFTVTIELFVTHCPVFTMPWLYDAPRSISPS